MREELMRGVKERKREEDVDVKEEVMMMETRYDVDSVIALT